MSSFRDYVDEWIEWCAERGIEPHEATQAQIEEFESSLGEPDLDAIEESRAEWEAEKVLQRILQVPNIDPTFKGGVEKVIKSL